MRKQGKKHSKLVVLPNGMRRDEKWELPIRAAIIAAKAGYLVEKQAYDLFVLAKMAEMTGAKGHYLVHSEALQRIMCDYQDNKRTKISSLEAESIEASANVLIEFVGKVKNVDIAKAALKGMR